MRRIREALRPLGLAAIAGLLAISLQACGNGGGSDVREGITFWPEPKPLPEVRFVDGDGRNLTLDDFDGKLVVLNIWATWCVPCREEMPTLDRLQGELGGEDFEVVALSIDQAGMKVVEDFYAEIRVEHLRRYLDQSAKAATTLNAVGVPATLILDRRGRELGRKFGAAEWDSPTMIALFREWMDERP